MLNATAQDPTVRIDPEFAALIPPLTDDEQRQLAAIVASALALVIAHKLQKMRDIQRWVGIQDALGRGGEQ